MATVDIIIPFHGQAELTIACLSSIRKCADEPYRIILIDNASGDIERAVVEKVVAGDPAISIIRNSENAGWVRGVNQGIAVSTAPYVIIMNNDTIVHTDGWLSKLINAAQSSGSIGLVNPAFQTKERVASAQGYIEVDFCRGYCILIKRAVIKRIGCLDESYGMGYYDDDDYSVRAIRDGFRCIRASDVYVEHLGDTTFNSLFEQPERRALHDKNKALFYAKWGRRLRILLVTRRSDELALVDSLMLPLARRQHIVNVWSPVAGTPYPHINIRKRVLSRSCFGLSCIARACVYRMKKAEKRFDLMMIDSVMGTSPLWKYCGFSPFDFAGDKDAILRLVDVRAGIRHAL